MSTLREAAQQALEACTDVVSGWESLAPLSVRRAAVESLNALRAALAEPTGKEALQVEPVQEPVAWIEHEWSGTGLRTLRFERRDPTVRDEVVNPVWTPLYTAPPQRKPLTTQQILDLFDSHNVYGSKWVEFARAIERAHGIGGQE